MKRRKKMSVKKKPSGKQSPGRNNAERRRAVAESQWRRGLMGSPVLIQSM